MDKNMQNYIRELSSDYINLTLDFNTYDKFVKDIAIVIKSRVKAETKIKKIKELLEVLDEKQR